MAIKGFVGRAQTDDPAGIRTRPRGGRGVWRLWRLRAAATPPTDAHGTRCASSLAACFRPARSLLPPSSLLPILNSNHHHQRILRSSRRATSCTPKHWTEQACTDIVSRLPSSYLQIINVLGPDDRSLNLARIYTTLKDAVVVHHGWQSPGRRAGRSRPSASEQASPMRPRHGALCAV